MLALGLCPASRGEEPENQATLRFVDSMPYCYAFCGCLSSFCSLFSRILPIGEVVN